MPGAKPYGFRLGDNAEILTEFIISRLAFTTRVPRTEDVGHDFLCSIAEKSGTIFKAGPFFTVQVKSNKEPLIFQKPHEIEWIKSQENPFFICIADRPALRIEVFSTWNMLNAFLHRGADKILLAPGEQNDLYEFPITDETKSEQIVPLGKPILEISADQIADDNNITKYA